MEIGKIKKLMLFGALFYSFIINAAVVDLSLWISGDGETKILMPVVEGKEQEQLKREYLEAIKNSTDYNPNPGSALEREIGTSSPFPTDSKIEAKPINAINPNELRQLNASNGVYRSSAGEMNRAGVSTVILPFGVDLILNQSEVRQFHELIAEKVPYLTLLGGADVHPSLYGEENTHSKNPKLRRDKLEVALIKAFTAREKGTLVAFCRGHQITAVAMGLKLHQDIPSEALFENAPEHRSTGYNGSSHNIDVVTDSILYEASGNKKTMEVNSYHHQAVVYFEEHPQLRITATEGAHKLVEAMEFKNGLGYTFQFHPEEMQNELSRRMLQKVVEKSSEVMESRRTSGASIESRSELATKGCKSIF